MKVSRCKGTRDLMPRDMARFRRIEAGFGECCTGWGYQEIRTPVLEYLHLFTSAGTLSPDMLGRVYSFLDWDGWSGERVVLRPDGTIPVARLYVENLQDRSLSRLFYVENVFAFEGTGKESRERWQCGAELIGGSKPEGDVELISLALECIGRLGIGPVEVRLAHAGLLKTLIRELGLSGEDEAEILGQVFSGNIAALKGLKGKGTEIQRKLRLLFDLKGSSPGFVENLRSVFSSSLSALEPELDELARISELLTGLKYSYQIDLGSASDFEYYTGVIFRFYNSGRRLGGGGRYDRLIPLVGGKDICASGFALYIDELMDMVGDLPRQEKILLRATNGEVLKASFDVARLLRKAGYVAEFDLGCQEPADFRWIVDMRGKGIELIDGASGKRQRESSAAGLLKSIGKAGEK